MFLEERCDLSAPAGGVKGAGQVKKEAGEGIPGLSGLEDISWLLDC